MLAIFILIILSYFCTVILGFTLSDEQGELMDCPDEFKESLSVPQYLLYYGDNLCNLAIFIIAGASLV